MSKNNNFKNIWKNQKEIGLIYGKSAIAVGKALVELGLRDDKNKAPTEAALEQEIAKSTPLKDGTPFFLWNKDKVCEHLDNLWNRQSPLDRDIQRLSSDYISGIRAALKADGNGEHHVIVDGLYDEAMEVAKKIKKKGVEFVNAVNVKILEAKLDKEYLISIEKIDN
jgi:hypothetical protein